jgi:hypothetical protein
MEAKVQGSKIVGAVKSTPVHGPSRSETDRDRVSALRKAESQSCVFIGLGSEATQTGGGESLDGSKGPTFRVSFTDLDDISPQLNAKINFVTLEKRFLGVFLEHDCLFHECIDGRIEAVVIGRVEHVGIFIACV